MSRWDLLWVTLLFSSVVSPIRLSLSSQRTCFNPLTKVTSCGFQTPLVVLYCPPHSLKPIQVTHQNHMALQVDVQSFSPVRGIYGASTTCDVVVVLVYLIRSWCTRYHRSDRTTCKQSSSLTDISPRVSQSHTCKSSQTKPSFAESRHWDGLIFWYL